MAIPGISIYIPNNHKDENMSMNFTKHSLGIDVSCDSYFGTIIILVSCNKRRYLP